MGRPKKQQFTNVREVSKSTIEIVFRYPTPQDRQREPIKLEPTPANLKRCYVHLAQINEAIKAGTFDYLATFPNSPRAKLYSNRRTFGTFLKHWLNNHYAIGPGTYKFYKRIIEGQVLKTPLAKIRVVDLTWLDVKDWALEMDVLAKTRSQRVAVLRDALNSAIEEGIIAVNPLYGKKLKSPKVVIQSEATRIEPFSWDERDAIIRAARRQFGLQLMFQFFTGLRPEEIRGLCWSRVDFIGCTIRIDRVIVDASPNKFQPPKSQASLRTVDLVGPAMQCLLAYKEYTFLRMPAPKKFPVKPSEADIVFVNPNTGNPWSSTNSIRDQWVDVLRKAGVRYRVPYQTRHTYASTMLQVGEDLEYVAEQMGHENSTTTLKHYARFIQQTGARHGSKLEEAYQKQIGN
jgi:integrase